MARPILLFNFCLLSSFFVWSASWALEAKTPQKLQAHKPASCGCDPENIDDVNLWLDMIFVVDSSDDVDKEDFDSIKTFLSTLSIFIAPQEKPSKHSRIAIINTGDTAEVFALLESYKTPEQMANDVMANLKQRGGNFSMTAGLITAREMVNFEDTYGSRTNVKKAVVVFSTRTWNCTDDGTSDLENQLVCQLFDELETDTTTLIAIGLKVGKQDKYPAIDIPNKCNYVTSGKDWVKDLLTVLCLANCYCLDPYTQFTLPEDGCKKFGECVYVEILSLPFGEAKATCEDQNNTMSTVYNKEKDEFLKDLHWSAQFSPYWIGMQCPGGQCVGVDGSIISDDSYLNWCTSRGQPNFAIGECVYEDRCNNFETGWFTAKCGSFMPDNYFSCQRNACSVNHYCEYLKKDRNQKISKRKVTSIKDRRSLLRSKLHRRL